MAAATTTTPMWLLTSFSDNQSYLSLLNNDLVQITLKMINYRLMACKVCRRLCDATHLNWYNGECRDCRELSRWGAYSKVWKADCVQQVAEKVKELYHGMEQRVAVKGVLNKSARWDNCGRPKRLLRNADLDIPPAPRKRRVLK